MTRIMRIVFLFVFVVLAVATGFAQDPRSTDLEDVEIKIIEEREITLPNRDMPDAPLAEFFSSTGPLPELR